MGKNTGPPKCRTCGKEEFRHLCGGLPEIQKRPGAKLIREIGPGESVVLTPQGAVVVHPDRPAILVTGEEEINIEALSSAVEPSAHNGLVAGSTPAAPTDIPASSSGRTPDFGSGKARSNRAAGAKKKATRQQGKKRDRNEYQRELMRKKRAADKAVKHGN